jgi:hypothetical protein
MVILNSACAWQSPGKGDRLYLKPFKAIQRVQLPPGKGAARQPEANLACGGNGAREAYAADAEAL